MAQLLVIHPRQDPVQVVVKTLENLGKHVEKWGLGLNFGKLQILVVNSRCLHSEIFQAFKTTTLPYLKKAIAHEILHLGITIPAACMDSDFGSKVEVSKRLQAATKAWNENKNFWIRWDVPLRYRVIVYVATCFSKLTAGLVAFVLSRAQEDRLEKWHIKRLRVMLLGYAAGSTNYQVRQVCNVPSVHAALLKRRIRFLQKVSSNPEHHAAWNAALTGNLHGAPEQLNGNFPSQDANPWLRQFWKDLQEVASLSHEVSQELQVNGWRFLYRSTAFRRLPVSRLKKIDSPCDDKPEVLEKQCTCSQCGQVCASSAGLASHAYQQHHSQPLVNKYVLSNACPLCGFVASTIKQTKRHLRRSFPRVCPTNRRERHHDIIIPKHLVCPE